MLFRSLTFSDERALAAARTVDIDDATAIAGIEAVTGVPGRVERVDVGQPFLVLVDYAHTPDGVANVRVVPSTPRGLA